MPRVTVVRVGRQWEVRENGVRRMSYPTRKQADADAVARRKNHRDFAKRMLTKKIKAAKKKRK